MSLEAGTLLRDRFRVLRPLGEGGMGEVYLGEDERGGVADSRPVAIKVLRSELGDPKSAEYQRRFREEIEILKRLNEVGVPDFVDAFQEGNRHFLIMEYVEGHSLAVLAQRSPNGLRPALVCEVGIQVCTILEHLHGQDPPLIHRDIKPANIIIRARDNSVFLVDFGLARELDAGGGARTLVGTVDYCPLEQLQGNPEPRSDLYALGATMFELLTGRVPKPLNIPPVFSIRPDLPPALCDVIDRSVRPDLDQRYEDAAALAAALRQALPQLGNTTAPSIISDDPVEKLLHQWGPGVAPRRKTPSRPNYRRALLLILLLVIMGYWANSYHDQQTYRSSQRELLQDAFPDGTPAAGWQVRQVQGLFPADGLGLGAPGSKSDAGVLFESPFPQPVRLLSLHLRRLKGNPELLVYCQPWVLRLEPRERGAMLHLLHWQGEPSLDTRLEGAREVLEPVTVPDYRNLWLRLSISDKVGQLVVNRDKPVKFPNREAWLSHRCGIVMAGASKNRCIIQEWHLR